MPSTIHFWKDIAVEEAVNTDNSNRVNVPQEKEKKRSKRNNSII
jgi:hypothetical protein